MKVILLCLISICLTACAASTVNVANPAHDRVGFLDADGG
ncbi:hypothetical protein GCM10027155_07490 [Acinetobacter apis]